MKELRVEIDAEKGTISVMNGGKGIPVEMLKEGGVDGPELIDFLMNLLCFRAVSLSNSSS